MGGSSDNRGGGGGKNMRGQRHHGFLGLAQGWERASKGQVWSGGGGSAGEGCGELTLRVELMAACGQPAPM